MKKNNILYMVTIIVGISLDLISKYFFYDRKYLDTFSLFAPVFNKGISRSLPVPISATILIGIAGIAIFIRLFIKNKINRLIAALLIAGTAGNLIDRIFLGGVRDFIDIRLFNFPIFNFADSMLSIGVIIRIFRVMLEKKE